MVTLEDVVDKILAQMTANQELFTALDVSNQVKVELPLARHREVRDLVRNKFASHIEPIGYAKTPIQVTLSDGSTVEALLYHPLVDSWDLDSKYDVQKRSQTVSKPAMTPTPRDLATQAAGINAAPIAGLPTLMTAHPLPKVVSNHPSSPVTAPVVPAPLDARARWQQLFNSQPSLFPRR